MTTTMFGDRLRAGMLAGLITPARLASLCKVSRQTIRHWLTLKGPDMSALHLVAIAVALNVRLRWLATGEGAVHRLTADVARAAGILDRLGRKQADAWLADGERRAVR